MEANEVDDLFHIAKAFPDPANKIIQQGLIDYTGSVYNDELKRMSQANISLHSNRTMARLITVFYEMNEKSIPNKELYAESVKRLNNLAQYRRLRIFAGNNEVPPVIWLVLLVGGAITVSYLRDEKHQSAIHDYGRAYGNDHDDFVFDICPRPSLYRDEQDQRGAYETGDGDTAERMKGMPVRERPRWTGIWVQVQDI